MRARRARRRRQAEPHLRLEPMQLAKRTNFTKVPGSRNSDALYVFSAPACRRRPHDSTRLCRRICAATTVLAAHRVRPVLYPQRGRAEGLAGGRGYLPQLRTAEVAEPVANLRQNSSSSSSSSFLSDVSYNNDIPHTIHRNESARCGQRRTSVL